MANLHRVTQNLRRVLLVVAVATAAPAGAQEFNVILRSLLNPPVCDLLLGLDTTGDCLHGRSSSVGQAIECIEDPAIPPADCPALSWAVPGDKVFYSHTSGIGVTDYDANDPDSCPNNCSPSCLQGGLCAVHCCTSVSGDEEDGLDFSYAGGVPSEEEIRLFVGKPVKISDVWLWSGSTAEFVFDRGDCPPVRVSYREGALPSGGDASFTFPGGGLYLPQNQSVVFENPSLFPGGTDRLGMQSVHFEVVNPMHIPRWQRACPAFVSVFDRGFANSASTSSFYWQRLDHAFSGPHYWRATNEFTTDNCGLPNYTGGRDSGACFQSAGATGGYDTSLISREIDLSGVHHPVLRFLANFQRQDDEVIDVMVSTDQGSSWTLVEVLTSSLGAFYAVGGEEVEIDLGGVAGEPSVELRFRFLDPVGPPGDHDYYAQIDDIVIFEDAALFGDGFESGDVGAWSSSR